MAASPSPIGGCFMRRFHLMSSMARTGLKLLWRGSLDSLRMNESHDRILTTHTGSLPRPPELAELMTRYSNREDPEPPDLWDRVSTATEHVVKRQADLGIDLI